MESYNDGGTNPVMYMTYDSFGNISTVTDAKGNTASTTYDVSYTFPETITSSHHWRRKSCNQSNMGQADLGRY